jgi:hypothetical protein
MNYKIRPSTPETVIYMDFGDGLLLDYSRFPSKLAAWQELKRANWVKRAIEQIVMDKMHEFTREDVLAAAQAGEAWPVLLGYVEPI